MSVTSCVIPLIPVMGSGFTVINKIKFATIEIFISSKEGIILEIYIFNRKMYPKLLLLTVRISDIENRNIRKIIERQKKLYEKTEYGILLPEDFKMENIKVSAAYSTNANYILIILDRHAIPVKIKINSKFNIFLKYLGV